MDVIHIVFMLVILGLAWWLFSTYILPRVPDPFRTIIVIVLAIFVILWLLNLAGFVGTTHFGRL